MTLELLDWAPDRALALYAHPGDVDISCGGTLAKWSQAGVEVHLVVCAQGDKGAPDLRASESELVAQRSAELRAAAAALGVTTTHELEGRDGELENDLALRATLVTIIRAIRPQVLLCPDPTAVFFGEHYFNHRDHRVVGWAGLDAAAPAAAMPRYFPDAGAPHAIELALLSGSLEPNVYVDIAATIEDKAVAVARHRSQLADEHEELGEVVRERAAAIGAAVGASYVEAFRRVRLGH